MGLSLKFQIISGSSTKSRVNQLKLEEKGLKQIELINNPGALSSFIENLR